MKLLIDILGAVFVGFFSGFIAILLLPNFLLGPVVMFSVLIWVSWRRGWYRDGEESRCDKNERDDHNL